MDSPDLQSINQVHVQYKVIAVSCRRNSIYIKLHLGCCKEVLAKLIIVFTFVFVLKSV